MKIKQWNPNLPTDQYDLVEKEERLEARLIPQPTNIRNIGEKEADRGRVFPAIPQHLKSKTCPENVLLVAKNNGKLIMNAKNQKLRQYPQIRMDKT